MVGYQPAGSQQVLQLQVQGLEKFPPSGHNFKGTKNGLDLKIWHRREVRVCLPDLASLPGWGNIGTSVKGLKGSGNGGSNPVTDPGPDPESIYSLHSNAHFICDWGHLWILQAVCFSKQHTLSSGHHGSWTHTKIGSPDEQSNYNKFYRSLGNLIDDDNSLYCLFILVK